MSDCVSDCGEYLFRECVLSGWLCWFQTTEMSPNRSLTGELVGPLESVLIRVGVRFDGEAFRAFAKRSPGSEDVQIGAELFRAVGRVSRG